MNTSQELGTFYDRTFEFMLVEGTVLQSENTTSYDFESKTHVDFRGKTSVESKTRKKEQTSFFLNTENGEKVINFDGEIKLRKGHNVSVVYIKSNYDKDFIPFLVRNHNTQEDVFATYIFLVDHREPKHYLYSAILLVMFWIIIPKRPTAEDMLIISLVLYFPILIGYIYCLAIVRAIISEPKNAKLQEAVKQKLNEIQNTKTIFLEDAIDDGKSFKCPKCQAENEINSKFCTNCAYEFPQIKICPKCQTENETSSKFCTNCGEKL